MNAIVRLFKQLSPSGKIWVEARLTSVEFPNARAAQQQRIRSSLNVSAFSDPTRTEDEIAAEHR